MRKILLAVISVTLFLAAQSVLAAPTNLLVNGGFEEPIVETPQLWDIFASGSSGLGWTVEWRSDIPADWGNLQRPDPALQELQRGVNGWLPQEGYQYAELDADWDGPSGSLSGEPASILIYQDVPTTARCKYELKFYFSPRPETEADDNVLEVRWDGSVVDTISRAGGNQTDWSEHTYTLTVSGATTRLQFTDLGTANSLGTFLDNITLIQTSCEEPSGCCGDITVTNNNVTRINNQVTVVASTGGNEIESGNRVRDGNCGHGRTESLIITGDASANASVLNVVNRNVTRIRRR